MSKTITVFEHQSLRLDEAGFDKIHLEALQRFHGEKPDFPYFALIHKGVKFNEYVGVVQVGNLMIEILPKADQGQDSDRWRRIFIGMLRASGIMDLPAPSSSRLKLKPNALLQLYFERYVSELERLLHRGLAKKYRKTEGNLHSVKGRIVFSKHIRYNVVHQERVYSAYSEFSRDHVLHQVLYKALKLLSRINNASTLQSRIDRLLLDFPEQTDVKVTPALFSRIILNRNTQHYGQALQIARMLLLNYHPDVSRGHHDVLAILFDMNLLWERFVFKTLQQKLVPKIPGLLINAQNRMEFWRPDKGRSAHMRPDICIEHECGKFIIDTKWKLLDTIRPSDQDLRQMYVYHTYFEADRVALVYPGSGERISGTYTEPGEEAKKCSLLPIVVEDDMQDMQKGIADKISNWIIEQNP
jgi:5-methylcytosine-specific restriction enzyme subunit McrC